jgi:hypothetical protein
MARHLYADRFACGNSLTKVVKGHFNSIPECHDAIIEACASSHDDRPDKFIEPSSLPDFQGLDLEWIVNHIKLTLNWLDIYPDWVVLNGDNLIEVSLEGLRIGYIKRNNYQYYSDRLFGLKSLDPNIIALHMVNLYYLDGVVDEIVRNRTLAPDYM